MTCGGHAVSGCKAGVPSPSVPPYMGPLGEETPGDYTVKGSCCESLSVTLRVRSLFQAYLGQTSNLFDAHVESEQV